MNPDETYKGKKREGFLYDDERQFIDGYLIEVPDPDALDADEQEQSDEPIPTPEERREELLKDINETKIKSRIKRGIGSHYGLRYTLSHYCRDLKRIRDFHQTVIEQPGGRWYFEDQILPLIESELIALYEEVSIWKEALDRDGLAFLRRELTDAQEPLYEGLDELNKIAVGDSEYTIEEIQQARRRDQVNAPKELEKEYQALKDRGTALRALLEDEELYEIFDYIAEHPGKKLPDRKKGDNTWNWWVSRFLDTEHEVVEEDAWGWQLTERGELIYKTIKNLEGTPVIKQAKEHNMHPHRVALTVIDYHLPDDIWD